MRAHLVLEYPKHWVIPETPKYQVIPDILGYLLPNDFQNWIVSGRVSKKLPGIRSDLGTRWALFQTRSGIKKIGKCFETATDTVLILHWWSKSHQLTQKRDWDIEILHSVNDWCDHWWSNLFLRPRKEIETDGGNMGPSVGSQGRALQTPQIPEPIQDHLEASRFKEERSQCEENHYLSFGNMDT